MRKTTKLHPGLMDSFRHRVSVRICVFLMFFAFWVELYLIFWNFTFFHSGRSKVTRVTVGLDTKVFVSVILRPKRSQDKILTLFRRSCFLCIELQIVSRQCFPICQEVSHISQMAIAFHRISPPCCIQATFQ